MQTSIKHETISCASSTPNRLGILLIDGFSILALSGLIEPLRIANKLAGRKIFDYALLGVEGGSAFSADSIRISVSDRQLASHREVEFLIVCAGENARTVKNASLTSWLRHAARHGSFIGAVEHGSHILANAGLLSGYACAVPISEHHILQELYRDLEVCPYLFKMDRNRVTCAGGTTSVDMMLEIISTIHGNGFAQAVGAELFHDRLQNKFAFPLMVQPSTHPKLYEAIRVMDENIELPISLGELCRSVGTSRRHLERLFKSKCGLTPGKFYMLLRLERAQQLLIRTSMPVTEIAYACGYKSHSHFSKRYSEHFGLNPRLERKNYYDGKNSSISLHVSRYRATLPH